MDDLLIWAVGISLGGGFVLSAVGTAIVRRVALRRQFVDHPGGHKSHTEPVALGGGIPITLALVSPIVLGFIFLRVVCEGGEAPAWIPEALRVHLPGLLSRAAPAFGIAAGAVVLHVLGLIDDARHLGPWVKLIVQFAVAGLLVFGFDVRMLTVLGFVPSSVVTILWIVLITNAFNFLDNMDGLSAGVAAITAAIFALAAIRVEQIFVPTLAFLVVGVMLGYLWHNFPPARIFMGDAGSLVIGYFMAVLTILTTYWETGAQQELSPRIMIPLIVLAVPLYDTASVVLIRLRQGISPFRGDQRHFSHRLVQRGMSPRNAVLTIYLATAATSLGAIMLPKSSWAAASFVILQCVCVVLMIAILEQVKSNDKA